MIIKLSWRNLWRNRRRTLITVASIVFAIVFAIFMDSLLLGLNKQMADSLVGVYSGHFQIQQEGYWEDKSLHNSFVPDKNLNTELAGMEGIKGFSYRLESVALLASNELTRGTLVMGIDPDKEKNITGFDKKIIQGKYLGEANNQALVGKGLAEKMNILVGDSLVLVGEGYHGASAADKYMVSGIIRLGSPDLDNNIVILKLEDAQFLYGAYDRLTSIPVFLKPNQSQEQALAALETKLEAGFTAKPWQEMLPMLTQSIGLIDAMRVITIVLLYILISFSILGTIIMMVHERLNELRIVLSIGMRKTKMQLMILIETFFMALLGAVLGFLSSYPLVSYFKARPIEFRGKTAAGWEAYGIDPILPTLVDFGVFTKHTLIILVVSILLSIYAIRQVSILKPVASKK
ncbi:ABC-type lipoprotein release transport system permease subunit [Gillisia sp. Hel_I_86]|uniref:ABC transporter permease n=1 Tax=Gillisia sp. Hel_I_86 TaxID=1249981 RepID=UPI00119926FA|nr:ABC transporter permease [Gillisia sp. Hel_I_86]TVZ28675.1 ABC-type lipoprotein release transport system permease subunit [Gillisia sp. Hel_I_86]